VTELAPWDERLWFLERRCGREGVLRRWLVEHVHGPLDVPALEAAFADLLARHQSLRTGVAANGDLPAPFVRDHVDASVPVMDLEGARLEAVLAAERDRPFDLATPPLVRVRVMRLASKHHVVVIVAHALAADGRTFRAHVGELGACYRERVARDAR
jgi:hypothetical protein